MRPASARGLDGFVLRTRARGSLAQRACPADCEILDRDVVIDGCPWASRGRRQRARRTEPVASVRVLEDAIFGNVTDHNHRANHILTAHQKGLGIGAPATLYCKVAPVDNDGLLEYIFASRHRAR